MKVRSTVTRFYGNFIIFLAVSENVQGYMVGSNPHHRIETIDSQGKFQLEWLVNWKNKQITFTATVQTTGYIGFGLSRNGKMTGADIVIGGVNKWGKEYFADYHAVGHQTPVRDPNQNWNLISGTQNRTHTILQFSRVFDTCDPQDYAITEDKISVIWAYGEKDTISYHFENRGVFQAHLLAPDHSPKIISEPHTRIQRVLDSSGNIDTSVKVWTVHREMAVPEQETLYWCTIHKTPRLQREHHLIGFNVRLHDYATRRHVHHLGVLHCQGPRSGPSSRELFESHVGGAGEACLDISSSNGRIPTNYCEDNRNNWAVGGGGYFQPPHIGLPFESEEYFLLQIHLDNPSIIQNTHVNISLDFFYTERLRQNEGGLFAVRHEIPGLPSSLLIPPFSTDHQIRGICGPQCTRDMLPSEGVSVFAVFLHMHNTGRKIRIRHFRKNRELPFIAADENFSPFYQPVQMLPQERKILPGDHVILECVYDSTSANGTVVGGFSTSQEMCTASLHHYQRILNFPSCSSQIDSIDDRRYFLEGVGNATWSSSQIEFLVDAPHPLAGMTISQVSNNHVNWTMEKRSQLEKYLLHRSHANLCSPGARLTSAQNFPVTVNYPYWAVPYQPDASCSSTHFTS